MSDLSKLSAYFSNFESSRKKFDHIVSFDSSSNNSIKAELERIKANVDSYVKTGEASLDEKLRSVQEATNRLNSLLAEVKLTPAKFTQSKHMVQSPKNCFSLLNCFSTVDSNISVSLFEDKRSFDFSSLKSAFGNSVVTLPMFPASLPKPSASGYSVNLVGDFIPTKMATGDIKKRRKYHQLKRNITLSWMFDQTDFEVFKNFVLYELHSGVKEFILSYYDDASSKNTDGVFSFKTPESLYKYEIKAQQYYFVTCELVQRLEPSLSPQVYKLMASLSNDLLDKIKNFNKWVNNDYPSSMKSVRDFSDNLFKVN